jgi:Rod binding domain-containing protein
VVLKVVRPTDVAAIAAASEKRAAAAAPTQGFAASEAAAPLRALPDTDATPTAFRKFEAMVLQSFLQSMLPSENEAVYGEGLAGDMWRSMMAEQIAGVMAERGGIGIADRILATHYDRMAEQGQPDAAASEIAIESALHEARRMALQQAADAASASHTDF